MSDPTLLEILSLGSDPPSVVPHFQSGLFDSLTNVTFDKVDKTRMTEMFSQQVRRRHLPACTRCLVRFSDTGSGGAGVVAEIVSRWQCLALLP